MGYVELNPTWTVPPTILRKDVLPADAQGHLLSRTKEHACARLVRTGGRSGFDRLVEVLDEAFPYTIRQDPGPQNALGRVKFIFPNSHFVFLHDTPSRGLFTRAERTFSSGCIRVEHPFELAELILNDPERDQRAAPGRRRGREGTNRPRQAC